MKKLVLITALLMLFGADTQAQPGYPCPAATFIPHTFPNVPWEPTAQQHPTVPPVTGQAPHQYIFVGPEPTPGQHTQLPYPWVPTQPGGLIVPAEARAQAAPPPYFPPRGHVAPITRIPELGETVEVFLDPARNGTHHIVPPGVVGPLRLTRYAAPPVAAHNGHTTFVTVAATPFPTTVADLPWTVQLPHYPSPERTTYLLVMRLQQTDLLNLLNTRQPNTGPIDTIRNNNRTITYFHFLTGRDPNFNNHMNNLYYLNAIISHILNGAF